MPTIAHILHRLDAAGAELVAVELAQSLGSRYRFVFFCLDTAGALANRIRQLGMTVHQLGRRPGIDWNVGAHLADLLAEERIDLAHAHQYTPFFYAALARLLPRVRRYRGPIIFTEHGRHYPDRRKLSHVLGNKLLLRRDDAVTAVGQFVRQALIAREGIPASRVRVIYNAPPLRHQLAATPASARSSVRAELGLKADQPVIVQVARFHPVKDHATAIRAFARVHAQCPEAVLLLAGEGPLRPDMEALVRQENLSPHVVFLGVRDDVPRLLAAADVFLLSSLSEGISLTVLEAMEAGLPIAATDVGGNGEAIVHGQTGLLSPRQDATALAANMLALLRDPALRRRMGDAGRARLGAQFNRQRMIEAYEGLYAGLLAGSNRAES